MFLHKNEATGDASIYIKIQSVKKSTFKTCDFKDCKVA